MVADLIPSKRTISRIGFSKTWRNFFLQIDLQSMVLPAVIFLVIFSYIPMYGVIIAFKNYVVTGGLFDGAWVGLKYFKEFLTDERFFIVLRNTMGINVLGLLIGFPAPIIFALLLNELNGVRFKKLVQTLSYLPHFVSWVIYGGLVIMILAPETGIINILLVKTGIMDNSINFIGKPDLFWIIFVLTHTIKGLGWGAILYIAAIANVNYELYESAIIEGANRFQKIIYITLPSITGTIVIMLIFAISAIMNTGFEQIYILQNPLNIDMAETIDTYVYKVGIGQMRFSYSTAVGLLRSVISVLLLLGANFLSKKITEKGLF